MKIRFLVLMIFSLVFALSDNNPQDKNALQFSPVGAPAESVDFQIVKPNLGGPLLLPSLNGVLKLTVAGKTEQPPTYKQLSLEFRNRSIALYAFGRSFYQLRVTKWSNPRVLYTNPSDDSVQPDNYKYWGGFRWEADIDVEVATTMEVPKQWPQLFDIRCAEAGGRNERFNPHAVYVDPRLGDGLSQFTILHVTDPHISGRNDRIPKVLKEVRTRAEYAELDGRYCNPNDNLRAAIAYANQKVRSGQLVLMAITGDVVDYYRDTVPKSIDPSVSAIHPDPDRDNYDVIRDILTGTDGLYGESLICPVFIVPGNHDFLKPEPPLNGHVEIANLVHIKAVDKYKDFGLTATEGQEYDHWTRGCPTLIGISGIEARLAVKKAGLYRLHLNTDEGYELTNPKHDHFGHYLTKINYETDFDLALGPYRFLFFNTGEDIVPTKSELINNEIWSIGMSDAKEDFLQSGSHNRGPTNQKHDRILEVFGSTPENGIVFCFMHAPMINLYHHRVDNKEILYEDNHRKAAPPAKDHQNIVTVFLKCMLDNKPLPADAATQPDKYASKDWYETLQRVGYTMGGVPYFNKSTMHVLGSPGRDWLNFACADGYGAGTLMEAANPGFIEKDGKKEYLGFTPPPKLLVLSGHTHKIHEFRTKRSGSTEYKIDLAYYLDDYSGTRIQGSQALPKASDKKAWLDEHSPLFLISGALKNASPEFREIVVKGNAIESMKMVTLPRFGHTPLAGLQHFFTAESIRLAQLGGYENESRNSLKPNTHFFWALNAVDPAVPNGGNDRAVVMWDLIDKYDLMFQYVFRIDTNSKGAAAASHPQEQRIYKELEKIILENAGFPPYDSDHPDPAWYNRKAAHSLTALFYAASAVRFNQLGVDFGSSYANSLDMQMHYNWALNASLETLQNEMANRICRVFDEHMLKTRGPDALQLDAFQQWYTSESVSLARAGRFDEEARNSLDPAYHAGWTVSVSYSQLIEEILDKYRKQAENLHKNAGLEGLRGFYAFTARRLDSWGTEASNTAFQVHELDVYLANARNMNAQQLYDALAAKARKLTTFIALSVYGFHI